MALEPYKPFLLRELVNRNITVKCSKIQAKKLIKEENERVRINFEMFYESNHNYRNQNSHFYERIIYTSFLQSILMKKKSDMQIVHPLACQRFNADSWTEQNA